LGSGVELGGEPARGPAFEAQGFWLAKVEKRAGVTFLRQIFRRREVSIRAPRAGGDSVGPGGLPRKGLGGAIREPPGKGKSFSNGSKDKDGKELMGHRLDCFANLPLF
jgi:hypothetical protein